MDVYVDRVATGRVAVERALPDNLDAVDLAVTITDHDTIDYDLLARSVPRILDIRCCYGATTSHNV